MTTGLSDSPLWGRQLDHALLRSVILPERKVVFVPMPKAGCTSLLWMLADIAGYKKDRFHRSTGRAVSQEMTIHDINTWGSRHRWKDLSQEERDRIARDDSWLRFTTVRDPAARLWSAWQSKLLLREPAIADKFTERSWFPRIPQSTNDIREDFLSFVKALAEPPTTRPFDVHWAPQTDILRTAPAPTYVGHVETMGDVVAFLTNRLGPVVARFRPPRENSSLLRYDPAVYDEESVDLVNELYARDFAELGYPPLRCTQSDFRHWEADSNSTLLVAIEGYASRHQRVARLSDRVKELTTRDETSSSTGHPDMA